MELIISKLHENKVILLNNIPSLLSDITCDIYCTKCLFRECINCRDKALEYNLSQATKTVTYRQWMYENSTYEKNGINNFTWNYSEPGHGKGAPDGVGGTLKRSADQAVAEGKDVIDLNVLKNVLSSKCPSIMLIEDTPAVSTRRKRKEVEVESNVKISKITPSEKNIYGYKVGDHVLITWNNEVNPGKILSLSGDGALVRCMKKGSKCWKWPTDKDEELYAWPDVLRIIEPPKLLSRVCYFVKEVDEKK
ncbi:hypothetical protein JTB14_029516 [Gonioctena quinquepunctata]|nr:hypothetical protein JTB14_029516 [Gonioctena quinquepunctata]